MVCAEQEAWVATRGPARRPQPIRKVLGSRIERCKRIGEDRHEDHGQNNKEGDTNLQMPAAQRQIPLPSASHNAIQ